MSLSLSLSLPLSQSPEFPLLWVSVVNTAIKIRTDKRSFCITMFDKLTVFSFANLSEVC